MRLFFCSFVQHCLFSTSCEAITVAPIMSIMDAPVELDAVRETESKSESQLTREVEEAATKDGQHAF